MRLKFHSCSKPVTTEQLDQVLFAERLEGTPVVLALSRLGERNGLGAVPGLVIVPLALLPITVPNVVRVILLKLIRINVMFPRELRLPKLQRFLHREANSLQE
jgi:hypothetical protein